MAALSIQLPFPVFTDADGQPVDGGYVWIGQANKDPRLHPVNVYFDKNLLIPAGQPLRTVGGYIVHDGSPAQLFIDGTDYSILVQNRKGINIYSFPSGTGVAPDSSAVTYTPAGAGAVARTVQDKLRETVSVKDFGAVGDGVADDTLAIQTAIDTLSADPGFKGMALFFPPGIYRTTRTITIDSSGFALIGANEKGAVSFSPMATAGSHILYDSNDGGPILKIGTNTAWRYGNKIHGLRIGAKSGLSVKPIGVQMNVCSEFSLTEFHINSGCSVGLALNACGIGHVQNFDISANVVGIDLYVDTTLPLANSNGSIWFSGANIWDCAEDSVRVRGSARDVVFRDSWIEYAKNIFHIVQQSDTIMSVIMGLYNVTASVSEGGPSDSRFIRCRALDGGTAQLYVRLNASNCVTFNHGVTHNIVYTAGTNSSSLSYLDRVHFDNCTFYGASIAVLTSDTSASTVFFTGRTIAQNGYASGVNIPLVDGGAKLHKLTSAFGYWDMQGSHPIRLPTVDSISFATEGQFYYRPQERRLAFTANGSLVRLPRPRMVHVGDESITVDVASSPETLRFDTTLTADRTVTLSTANAYNGAKLRVFRTPWAGGPYVVDVGPGLKTLAAGQWCDVEFSGDYWYITAFGSL